MKLQILERQKFFAFELYPSFNFVYSFIKISDEPIKNLKYILFSNIMEMRDKNTNVLRFLLSFTF